jgi:hypothetical protein
MITFQVQLWTPDKMGNLHSGDYQRVDAESDQMAAEKVFGGPLTRRGQNAHLRALVRRLNDLRSCAATPFYGRPTVTWRILDWVRGGDGRRFASDRNRAVGEVSEFLKRMMEAPGTALGMTAVQAAEVATRLYTDTDGEIDLRSPRAALALRPVLLTELTEAVIQLQRAGRQFEAAGTILWACTLRAERFPELRSSVKRMWSLISEGGFPFVEEAATLYEEKTKHSLPNDIIQRARYFTVPESFDD